MATQAVLEKLNTPVTLQQIADASGVSRVTVSRILRKQPYAKEETRKRVLAEAERLGYTPNPLIATLMSQLRRTRSPEYVATIALLTPDKTTANWRLVPTYSEFYQGAKKRLEQMGYKLDEFSVNPSVGAVSSLRKTLRTRGIHGAIVFPQGRPLSHISLDFSELAVAAIGYSSIRPKMHRVAPDFRANMRICIRELRHLGYRRIGFVLPAPGDVGVGYGWSAEYLIYSNFAAKSERIPLGIIPRSSWGAPAVPNWVRKHRVDALIAMTDAVRDWLIDGGIQVPSEIGFASLDATSQSEISGANQLPNLVGEAAADMVVQQLQNNERGLPAHARVTLIEGAWHAGSTTRRISKS